MYMFMFTRFSLLVMFNQICVCTVTRLFTSKVGGMEEEEKGEEDTGP